jgi:hypothetical protein
MRHGVLGVGVFLLGVALALLTTDVSVVPDAATRRAALRDAPSYVHLRSTRDELAWRSTMPGADVRWTPFVSMGRLFTQDDPKGSMEALKALHDRSWPEAAPHRSTAPPAELFAVSRLLIELEPGHSWRYVAWLIDATDRFVLGATLLDPAGAYVDLAPWDEDAPWAGPESGLLRGRVVASRTADGSWGEAALVFTRAMLVPGEPYAEEMDGAHEKEIALPDPNLGADAPAGAWDEVTHRLRAEFTRQPCQVAVVQVPLLRADISCRTVLGCLIALERAGCTRVSVLAPAPLARTREGGGWEMR